MATGALSGVLVLSTASGTPRRPRRIGGRSSSQNERRPAILRFRSSPGVVETWDWRSQCYCGSINAKIYRRAWWCPVCGREKNPAKRPSALGALP